MKLFYYVVVMTILAGCWSCGTLKVVTTGSQDEKVTTALEADSLQYELIVLDAGFTSWFQTNRKPEWFYTQNYLENWNTRYVAAWNEKVMNQRFQRLNSDNPFIEEIDYRSGIDYGLKLNHTLFHYFKYIEEDWGPVLSYIPRRK